MGRNLDRHRASSREYYRRRYQSDPEFREAEARRKAEWYRGNERRKKAMRDYFRRLMADEKKREERNRKRREAYARKKRLPADLERRIQKRIEELFG